MTDTGAKKSSIMLFVLSVIMLAANMRACYTGVGVIVGLIQAELGLSGAAAGMITTIPILIFAFVCPLASAVSGKIGIGKMLLYGMLLNAFGSTMRAFGGALGLFAGTVVLAVGIAFLNALVVGLIKLRAGAHTGMVTSCYTTTMALTSAIGISINVPLAQFFGWRGTLAFYGVLALICAAIWLPQSAREENRGTAASGEKGLMKKLLRSPRAWALTVFMGGQSMLFYCLTAWVPTVLQWKGMSASQAGVASTVLQLVSLPSTLLIPVFAEKFNCRRILCVLNLGYILGLGLFCAASAGSAVMWLAIVLMAFGLGSGFSACIFLFSKKTASPAQTAAISGFAQCGGYIFAAVGPVLMGWMFDRSGSWNGAMLFCLGVCIVMSVFAAISADYRSVFEKR